MRVKIKLQTGEPWGLANRKIVGIAVLWASTLLPAFHFPIINPSSRGSVGVELAA